MVDFVRFKQLQAESSLNSYYMCDHCKRKLSKRSGLIRHLQKCKGSSNVVCDWCNIGFTNRGNMVKHMLKLHNGRSRRGTVVRSDGEFNCTICDQKYNQNWQLWYHIRRVHYNLLAKTPFCQMKKVNQVWFEKVINSNTVMEIKKTSNNSLVMRPLGPNTAIKVAEVDRPVTDLRTIYPTGIKKKKQVQCSHCQKLYDYRSLSKHMAETHYDIKRHLCKNCGCTFKRHYLFLRHVCFKQRNRRARDPSKADSAKKDFRSKLMKQMPFVGQVGHRR